MNAVIDRTEYKRQFETYQHDRTLRALDEMIATAMQKATIVYIPYQGVRNNPRAQKRIDRMLEMRLEYLRSSYPILFTQS